MNEIVCGYRFVTEDLRSENDDIHWKIGEWVKYEGSLKLCVSGLHACREPIDSLGYIYGSRWFEIEARGNILEGEDKFCASEMRLIREISPRIFVMFAIEAAKHVLPLWEKEHPLDDCAQKAIEAAEECLRDPTEENKNAAWSAEAATRSAAWGAGGAAARAAWSAAWAVGAAARSVARSVAWATVWAAEAAARAARAAEAAARAAWAATAERKWQNTRLIEIINREVK